MECDMAIIDFWLNSCIIIFEILGIYHVNVIYWV